MEGLHLGMLFHVCCYKFYLASAKNGRNSTRCLMDVQCYKNCVQSENKYRHWLVHLVPYFSPALLDVQVSCSVLP